jgi:hypothetical protein
VSVLVPYRVRSAVAEEAGFHRLVVTMGGEFPGPAAAVQCDEVVVRVPYATPAGNGEPVGYRVKTTPVTGRTRGRHWEVAVFLNDLAGLSVACVPAATATFDGSWDITVTVDVDRPLGGTTEIRERTHEGDGVFAPRSVNRGVEAP